MPGSRLKRTTHRVFAAAAGLLCGLASAGDVAQGASDDWPDWVEEEDRLRQRIAAVNEGELSFLDAQPDGAVHHHVSRIAITAQSLVDGWVLMEQCHDNLDRVAAAQIVFNPARSRALQVLSFRNIEAAYAEANTIQLRGIGAASEICLRAESRALQAIDPGVFELQNGPFMRRFLDGYYPLHLSLQIDYPAALTLADFSPEAQPGFVVSQAPGRIHVEAVFEGRLHTSFRFVAD